MCHEKDDLFWTTLVLDEISFGHETRALNYNTLKVKQNVLAKVKRKLALRNQINSDMFANSTAKENSLRSILKWLSSLNLLCFIEPICGGREVLLLPESLLFDEMRYTKTISVWPVGLVGGVLVKKPIVLGDKLSNSYKVTGWKCGLGTR